MTILELSITDMKRISAIEINPKTGQPIVLTGDNAQGKSSVLDSVILALSNTGLDDPIRHGRPSGNIRITLGEDKAEYLLERKVTKKGNYLTLTDANGVQVQKAQTFLNGLMGNYAFDPLEFVRLKPKAQVEALKAAAGLDFTEVDAERATAYSERTTVARDGKELKAQLDAIAEPAEGLPEAEVSAVTLIENLQTLEEKDRIAERLAEMEDRKTVEVLKAADKVSRLEQDLAEARNLLAEHQKVHTDIQTRLEAAHAERPSEEAMASAKSAIASVEETNAAIRAEAKRRELSDKVKALRLKHASLSATIERVDERKAEAIKNANLPLNGLELTDDGVMFNGTFFTQLSTAEQIRISTLVAMSQNPQLRIIIIREGALMNSDNLAMMSGLAAERGFQLWIEKFQESPSSTGLHIIDGEIAFVDGEPVEKETLQPA